MFAYRLSVVGSVAPPGMAWDAEGLRGNEANENNLMVLVRMQTRKCQSGRVLHKRTLPVGASGFRKFDLHLGTEVVAGNREPDLHPAGDFAGPLLSLPVGSGDGIGLDTEVVTKAAGGFPLAALVRQHELVNRTQ